METITNEQIKEVIVRALLEEQYITEEAIEWDASLYEHGLDSLDVVEFFMEVENQLQVSINSEQPGVADMPLSELPGFIIKNMV